MARKTHFYYRFILTSLLLAGTASAESKWTHLRSDNLEMYTETTPLRAQETARSLEQIHNFFAKSMGVREDLLGTTYVIGFKSEEDFLHFRPKVDTVSYYVAGADRDYLVLGLPETDAFEPAARAYAELLTKQLGAKLPVWLEESLNGFYATFTERGAEVVAGELGPIRRKALVGETWAPMSELLGNTPNNRALRNQRFALIHMLLLSPDYAPKFKNLIAELQTGASSTAAMEKAYGKPLSAIEKEIKDYSNGPAFVGTAISLPGAVVPVTSGEPASMFDVNLALAGITNQPGRESDVQAWYDRLAGMSPERPEPWAGMGYVALRRGQNDLAAKDFDKAISLGSRDPSVLWTRSRIGHVDAKETEESVRRQLDRDPARVDLRVKLAAIELDRRRPAIAYSLLRDVKDVPAEVAPRFLTELAYAQMETGEKSAAKVTVARLDDRNPSGADRTEADHLKDFLTEPTRLTLGSNTTAAVLAAAQERAEAQKAAEEAREKELADARSKAAEDARQKLEAKAREKAEADARAQAAEEARLKLAEEARQKAAEDAKERIEAKAREKAEKDAQAKAAAEARQKAAADAREKALADAREKADAKAREKAEKEAAAKAAEEAHQKLLADMREKAAADARAKAQADADAKAKAAEEARLREEARVKEEAHQKAEQSVLAQAAKETKETAQNYAASAQPQQASNLVPDSGAPQFPSMLSGSFVELGCGDQIKVVVQTDKGTKNFRIKNPANVIVSGKGGSTVDLNCGPQKPTNVRIQYGPGEGGFDGSVEAIYFE